MKFATPMPMHPAIYAVVAGIWILVASTWIYVFPLGLLASGALGFIVGKCERFSSRRALTIAQWAAAVGAIPAVVFFLAASDDFGAIAVVFVPLHLLLLVAFSGVGWISRYQE